MSTLGERSGLKPKPLPCLGEAPQPLRMAIWNALEFWLFDEQVARDHQVRMRALYRHLHWPAHTVAPSHIAARDVLKYFMEDMDSVEVFEFVEYCVGVRTVGKIGEDAKHRAVAQYMSAIDQVMEAHGVPLRFVNYELCPLTSELVGSEAAPQRR
jgi:hypothetical protein